MFFQVTLWGLQPSSSHSFQCVDMAIWQDYIVGVGKHRFMIEIVDHFFVQNTLNTPTRPTLPPHTYIGDGGWRPFFCHSALCRRQNERPPLACSWATVEGQPGFLPSGQDVDGGIWSPSPGLHANRPWMPQ